jgi:hypothetical protein
MINDIPYIFNKWNGTKHSILNAAILSKIGFRTKALNPIIADI